MCYSIILTKGVLHDTFYHVIMTSMRISHTEDSHLRDVSTAFQLNIPLSICPQIPLDFGNTNLYHAMIEIYTTNDLSTNLYHNMIDEPRTGAAALRVLAHFIGENAETPRG